MTMGRKAPCRPHLIHHGRQSRYHKNVDRGLFQDYTPPSGPQSCPEPGHETGIPQLTMVVPRAGYVYLGENIKDAVRHTKVKVSMANRINTPQLAESILQQEKVDIIALGRGLITDPEFLIKTREGRFDEIRKCAYCNYCMESARLATPNTTCIKWKKLGIVN